MTRQRVWRNPEFDTRHHPELAADDYYISPSWGRRLQEDIPGARTMALVPFCGHFWQEERPAEFASIIGDFLAEQLLAARDRGIRVVGMVGCNSGNGTSTTLLCAARQLAKRGTSVAIVDANLADPQLARRLGLLPELGLEDLLDGRQPLEEVAIESVSDKVALAPLGSAYIRQLDSEAAGRLSGAIETLADAYDLVLVDLGSLENSAVADGSVVEAIRVRPTAVVLVQHDETTTEDRLIEAGRTLGHPGVELLGLIRNFRRG